MAQKPKANRRPISFRNSWKPQLFIAAGITAFPATNKINVTLDRTGLFGPLDEIEWSLTEPGEEPALSSSAQLLSDGLFIELTFTDVKPLTDYQLVIPAWNSGFRSAQGGYVAPAILNFTTGA